MTSEPPIDVGAYGLSLAELVVEAVPGWAESIAVDLLGPTLADGSAAFGRNLADDLRQPLTKLLTTDIDEQRQSPLALVRRHVGPFTGYLLGLGAVPRARDAYDEEAFPDDVFGIAPKAWSDFGDEVADAGLRWGAAKAMAHRRRHMPG